MGRIVRIRRRSARSAFPSARPAAVEERPNSGAAGIRRAAPKEVEDTTVLLAASTSMRTVIVSKLAVQKGIRVLAVADGEVPAIERASQKAPDVSIIDMNLGGKMEGLAIARSVQRVAPTTGLLLLIDRLDSEDLSIYARDFGSSWSYMVRHRTEDGALLSSVIQSVARGVHWLDPEIRRSIQNAWEIAAKSREMDEVQELEDQPGDASSKSTSRRVSSPGDGWQGKIRSVGGGKVDASPAARRKVS
ncbi:MAG: hypothetical protein WD208_06620 [Dehalococcoidia bacterium]